MPKLWLICLVLLGLVTVSMECVSAGETERKAASALNTKGYHAYKAGQLSKALVLFQQSVKTDPTMGRPTTTWPVPWEFYARRKGRVDIMRSIWMT